MRQWIAAVISEDRLQKALVFLAESDELSAELKGNVARCEFLAKRVRARKFLLANGGSVESRKAVAEESEEVARAEDDLAKAIVEHEKIRAKRTTEALIVEVFRTLEASRRQGQ